MKNIIIIGARGFGREIFDVLLSLQIVQKGEWKIKGFLDSDKHILDGYLSPNCVSFPPIIDSVESYIPQEDDLFFCALGDNHYRKYYSEIILSKGGQFTSIISPYAYVSYAATIGAGCFIGVGCQISNNVKINDFSIIHPFCVIGHDVTIGKYNSVGAFCFFGGESTLGDVVTFHSRSNILPKKRLGNNVTVGTGSVVIRNYGDNVHLFGNPAIKMNL